MPNRPVTIVDVAKLAGVAISSASAALNNRTGVSEATRRRVQDAAQELGFVPSLRARGLSSRRAYSIGLVLQRHPDVLETDPFFGAFIGGIEQAIAPRGYALVLQLGVDLEDTAKRYRELAANRRVDGVFVNEVLVDDPRVTLLPQLGLPAVAILPENLPFPGPAVRQSSSEGIAALVRHLTDIGHRRIGHVRGEGVFVHTQERERAWLAELDAAGLEPGPVADGDFSFEGGRRAADEILGTDPRPTAVVCANDLSAVGFMARAQELGLRVPEDISVTGFDGITLGTYVKPPLTTIQTTPREVGRAAATLLLDLIDQPDRDHPDLTVPPGEIVVRGSTAPASVTTR